MSKKTTNKVLPLNFDELVQIQKERNDTIHNKTVSTLLSEAFSYANIARDVSRNTISRNQAVTLAEARLASATNKLDKGMVDKTVTSVSRLQLLAEVNPTQYAKKVARQRATLELANMVAKDNGIKIE